MRQVLVDPFWRMLLAVALIVGLVAPAVAVPMVLLNTNPVEAASCIEIASPTANDTVCAQPGCCVDVCWNFCCESPLCEPIDNFHIWILNDGLVIGEEWVSVGGLNCSQTSKVYNICRCVYLDQDAPEGVYDVQICSNCGSCACARINGSVVVDDTPPNVTVTSPAPGANWGCNETHYINWTISDEDCLNEVVIEYWNGSAWVHMYTDSSPGLTGGSHQFTTNGTLEDCNFQVRVTATDCCNNSGSDTNDPTATIDCTKPVVSNVAVTPQSYASDCNDTCLVGNSNVNISFDYSDNCGPLKANISYKACNNGWQTIASDVALSGTSGTHTYPWIVPATLDCCDIDGGIEFNVTVTDCPGNVGYNTTNTCVVAPLIFMDAITGWCWHWADRCDRPMNCNDRSTIMVVFNKELDLSTVSISDFKITNPTMTIIDMEIHYGSDVKCEWLAGPGWDGTTLVFLKVSAVMATNAQPTVGLVGCIEALDAGVEPLCGTPTEPIYLSPDPAAQDGIAPIITLATSPTSPEFNDMVTVTATSSEPLKEAYLIVLKGNPDDYNWSECKPIGWPVDWNSTCNVSPCEWENTECCKCRFCANWTVMTIGGTGNKTATGTFLNTFGPNDPFFIEVAAHDFSHCVVEEWPWKHEKWTQESLKFHAWWYFTIDLCEGWNLISVPRTLTNPAISAALPGSAVHKAYYYTGGNYGAWKSAAYTVSTGMWSGSLTTIEPGKGYWVYCSPPHFTLRLYFVESTLPQVVPPSYSLLAGWNLIGYHDYAKTDSDPNIESYLATLFTNARLMYYYDACDQEWERSYVDPDDYEWDWSGDFSDVDRGKGYWLYLMEAGTLAP